MSRSLPLLLVLLAGCATTAVPPPESAAIPADAREDSGLFGRDWIFVQVEGYDGPLPSPPPVAGFNITREGRRVTGTTACNSLIAGYEVNEQASTLRFTSLRNARDLCDRVASDTEEAVLDAMIATDSYRLDGTRLDLFSKGRPIARLTTPD